jgi:hypothetical protein
MARKVLNEKRTFELNLKEGREETIWTQD